MVSICGTASPNSLSVRKTLRTSKFMVVTFCSATFCSAKTALNINDDMRSPIESNWSFKSFLCKISSWNARDFISSSKSFSLLSTELLSASLLRMASSISTIDWQVDSICSWVSGLCAKFTRWFVTPADALTTTIRVALFEATIRAQFCITS